MQCTAPTSKPHLILGVILSWVVFIFSENAIPMTYSKLRSRKTFVQFLCSLQASTGWLYHPFPHSNWPPLLRQFRSPSDDSPPPHHWVKHSDRSEWHSGKNCERTWDFTVVQCMMRLDHTIMSDCSSFRKVFEVEMHTCWGAAFRTTSDLTRYCAAFWWRLLLSVRLQTGSDSLQEMQWSPTFLP